MKLVGISINNFQAHEKLKIAFDREITSIVGESNAGKSSVIRAINWVLYNGMRGSSFIRQGADECRVNLKIIGVDGEPHIIGRRRSRGQVNEYIVDGKVLKSFKNEVPEQVQVLTGLSSLNLQTQADPHFWVGLSPAELSRKMNEVVEIDAFDRFLKAANRESSDAAAALRIMDSRKEQLKLEREKMVQKSKLVRMFREEIEPEYEMLRSVQEDYDTLHALVSELETLESQLDIVIPDISELELADSQVKEVEVEIRELRQTIGRLEEASEEITVPDLTELETLKKDVTKTNTAIESIKGLIEHILGTSQKLDAVESELKQIETKLGKIEVCPTCGTKIKNGLSL